MSLRNDVAPFDETPHARRLVLAPPSWWFWVKAGIGFAAGLGIVFAVGIVLYVRLLLPLYFRYLLFARY